MNISIPIITNLKISKLLLTMKISQTDTEHVRKCSEFRFCVRNNAWRRVLGQELSVTNIYHIRVGLISVVIM